MKKLLALTILLLGILVVLTAVFTISNSSVDVIARIVQAEDMATAVALVEDYGGQVNEELAIIDAVSASLPESALTALAADNRTVAVYDNNMAEIAGKRSRNPVVHFPQVMGADEAWEEGVKGRRITVAVVDTSGIVTASLLVTTPLITVQARKIPAVMAQ